MDYLAELLEEKKQFSMFPNFFPHMGRLLDDEIVRARSSAFKHELRCDSFKLPDPVGKKIQLQEKVFVPLKEHPDYNFVGRILGPRGMTAKQLEQETGCKIMIRGKGSLRDANKEDLNRGKPNYEHLDDELHVLIQCDDTKERASIKLANAVSQIKKLLVLPATQGIDELKRKQLMELSIINGTYRSPGLNCSPPIASRLANIDLSQSQRDSPFSSSISPPLPAFFESSLSSPRSSNDSSMPSLSDLHKAMPCPIPPMSQEALDFNLNMIMKAINEQSLESKQPMHLKKNPWLQSNWRNGGTQTDLPFFDFNGGGDADGKMKLGNSVGIYRGPVQGPLVCNGCGAVGGI